MDKPDAIEELTMRYRKCYTILSAFSLMLFAHVGSAAELPASFPADVPIADYMELSSVTDASSLMLSFDAPGKDVAEIVAWFKNGLMESGWSINSELVTDTQAILPFTKDGRRCDVSITDFVMNSGGQLDRTTKGITLLIVGASKPPEGVEESAIDAAGEAAN